MSGWAVLVLALVTWVGCACVAAPLIGLWIAWASRGQVDRASAGCAKREGERR